MEHLSITPQGKTPEEITTGVWYPRCFTEYCSEPSSLFRSWWPSVLHHDAAATANGWAFDAARRWEEGKASDKEIRAEYQSKFSEVCAESNRLIRAEREKYIGRNILPEYRREIDRARLKAQEAFDRVQLWTPGGEKPGMIVFGDTGRGKTRAVFHRLAALHREHGTMFLALTADELKRQLIAAALSGEVEDEGCSTESYYCPPSRNPTTVEGKLRAAEIVFVDDLSQTKLTPHYAERLFAIVEHRAARGLPLIVTVQMDGDRLARKLAGYEDQFADTAACLVRRLRDFCQPVNFGFEAPQ